MHNRHELEKMRGGVPFARVIEFTRAVLMAGADDVTIDLKRATVAFRFTVPCRAQGQAFERSERVTFDEIDRAVDGAQLASFLAAPVQLDLLRAADQDGT